MKKSLLLIAVTGLTLASCTTVKKTATSMNVATSIEAVSTADLDVSDRRITFGYEVPKKVRRGGTQNVYNVAVREALRYNGGGDVLVAPQFDTRIRRGLFGKKIKEVIVSGYPATYKNFKVK